MCLEFIYELVLTLLPCYEDDISYIKTFVPKFINESTTEHGHLKERNNSYLNSTRLDFVYINKLDTCCLSSITNLAFLNLNTSKIFDITFLSSLVNLTYLNLSCTRVKNLTSITLLPNLIRLNLSFISFIGYIHLPDLTKSKIQHLDVSHNIIQNVDYIPLNLKTLIMKDIKLDDISFLEDIKTLEFLDISNNSISDISSLSKCIYLKTLDLSNNEITDISSISELYNIKSLNLSNNEITDISSILGLRNIEWLNLSNTKITEIRPLSILFNLSVLILEYTNITDLEKALLFKNLRYLYIEGVDIDINLYEELCENMVVYILEDNN